MANRRTPATDSTLLRRHLEGAAGRLGPLDALREGKRLFQAGERIDMQGLAGTLGVDRATLYRWVGSREHLLVEVLWALQAGTFRRLREPGPDGARPAAAAVLAASVQASITNTGLQRFLQREGDLALKLMTSKATDFQQRFIDLVADVVDDDRQAGRLRSPVPYAELPYLLVRVMESYVYLNLITGADPEPDRASRVLHALLPNELRESVVDGLSAQTEHQPADGSVDGDLSPRS